MASHSMDNFSRPPSLDIIVADESEIEEDVDQLDSDSEVEEDLSDRGSRSAYKGGFRRSGQRVPGNSLLPTLRLENIIQADGVTGNLALSKEGLFLLSAATEEFIKRMAQAGHRQASTERRNLISYRDMSSTTQQYQEFMFLRDTIPTPLTLSEALLRRESKEKELMEDDPAILSTFPPPSVSTSTLRHPSVDSSKAKSKTRVTNGHSAERKNGRASSSKGRTSELGGWYGAPDPETNGTTRSSNRDAAWYADLESRSQSPRTSLPVLGPGVRPPAPILNGYEPDAFPSGRSQAFIPIRSRDDMLEQLPPPHQSHRSRQSPYLPPDDSWPGQYTGPASGFLQESHSHGHMPQNPGRTIYSHHRPE